VPSVHQTGHQLQRAALHTWSKCLAEEAGHMLAHVEAHFVGEGGSAHGEAELLGELVQLERVDSLLEEADDLAHHRG